jgi:hypothetical protein
MAATTKQYFPTVQDRQKIKIIMTSTIVAMVTRHGKMRAYFHHFKLLADATPICMQGDQTTDHLLNHWALLQTQRTIIKQNILKTGNWLASKQKLTYNEIPGLIYNLHCIK